MLLTSKREEEYSEVLKAIADVATAMNIDEFFPDEVMSDLELAIINAIQTNLPLSEIALCFFHLKKAMYRHVQSLGLVGAYNDPNDRSLKVFIHMLAALAFVPPEDVMRLFKRLKREAPANAGDFVSYFEDTYVGISAQGRRLAVAPRYEIHHWNHYQAVLDGKDTTNNASEGWHNRFRNVVNKHHPDLYSCLKEFQKEQADVEISLLELAQGKAIKDAPNREWVESKMRLQRIVRTYVQKKEQGQVMEYLKTIANIVVLD